MYVAAVKQMQMQPEDPVQRCEVQLPRFNIPTPRLQVDIRLLTHKLIGKTQTVRLTGDNNSLQFM